MEFIAIDVETSNSDMASICQIGVAKYKNGILIDEWETLINPEDYYDEININIHGIDDSKTRNSPKFPHIFDKLKLLLESSITISHTHFDRVSIIKAIQKYSLPQLETTWIDSAKIARRTWPECSQKGYGLASVCNLIGYKFNHHNALEDAKACANIVLSAISKTGIQLQEWKTRTSQPINGKAKTNYTVNEANPEGDLFGEELVFTGSLQIPRSHAANLAAKAGCVIKSAVTKKTSILVVGDQDITKLAGKQKSEKHIKAEQLILKGQKIRILKESDFKSLIEQQ